jgi:MFS family permease
MFASIFAVILVLAMMFLCGRYTAKFAARRGRSKVAWFLLGSLLFPFSSIVLALLPSHGEEKAA